MNSIIAVILAFVFLAGFLLGGLIELFHSSDLNDGLISILCAIIANPFVFVFLYYLRKTRNKSSLGVSHGIWYWLSWACWIGGIGYGIWFQLGG